jgi:hypothetical protein
MDLDEALALIEVVSDFNFEASEDKPSFTIYGNQKGGYDLLVKPQSADETYRRRLQEIIKSRNLLIHESDGCLVIMGR